MNKIKYICIEREYGSGGTSIAKEVAKQLNINFYGHEILEEVAKKYNLPVEDVDKYEEKASNGILYSMFVLNQSTTGDPDLLSKEAKVFVAENEMIQKLALNGPCVFLGHSAANALKDKKNVLRVFVYAEEKDKHKRIIKEYGVSPKNVKFQCKVHNYKRSHFYQLCTHKKWRDFSNYDILLNSSKIGTEGCVKALVNLYKSY